MQREMQREKEMERILREQDLENYRCYLVKEERAAATIFKYIHDVRVFLSFLSQEQEDSGDCLSQSGEGRGLFCRGTGGCIITRERILAFKQALLDRYQIRSVNSMLAALNSFFVFLGWEDFRVKLYRVQPQIFSEEEREINREEYFRLLAAAKQKKKERLALLLQTLCGLGLRISELKAVTVEAVAMGRLQIYNKGKSRSVFIGKPLQRQLLVYIRKKRLKKGEVFITKNGKSLDRSNVWREMKQLCEASMVPVRKVFPHNLRHLFAHAFYEMQKDVVKLAAIMGHSSMETTRIYTAVSGKECRKQMEALRLVL